MCRPAECVVRYMEKKMGKITVETCEIEGLKIITPTVFGDARGYFMETYNYNDFKEAGIPEVFVQDNQSASKKGVLRGLHFQKHREQERQGGPRSLHHRDIPQKSNPPHALAYGGLLAVRKIPVGGHPF